MHQAFFDRTALSNEDCSVARTLDLVGSRVTLLLLREAFLGTRRFDDFARRVDVSEPTAARRLSELTSLGLFKRVPYRDPGQRERHEYVLTAKGRDLLPVLTALREWGDTWAPGPNGPPFHPVHTACSAPVRTVLRCEADHPIGIRDQTLAPGPKPSSPHPADVEATSVTVLLSDAVSSRTRPVSRLPPLTPHPHSRSNYERGPAV